MTVRLVLKTPLVWPTGYPRTAPDKRRRAKRASLEVLYRRIERAAETCLDAIGGPQLTGSPTGDDPGYALYLERQAFGRSGILAVGIACDAYLDRAANLRAIAETIDALKRIRDRSGENVLEQALASFTVSSVPWPTSRPYGHTNGRDARSSYDRHTWSPFPGGWPPGYGPSPGGPRSPRPSGPSCWEVLGVSKGSTKEEIKQAYRDLAKRHHPDLGGSAEQMARVNAARDEALRSIGETR
jgi:hypothetical protein